MTWNNIKLNMQEDIAYRRFKDNPFLKELLLDPGDKGLFEGKMDRFYGVGYCLDMTGGNRCTGNGRYPASCMLGTGPCICIINSLISELWTPDVSWQNLLEIHKFVTW